MLLDFSLLFTMQRQTSPFVDAVAAPYVDASVTEGGMKRQTSQVMQRQTTPDAFYASEMSVVGEDDYFKQRNIDMPRYLNTEYKRWATLLLVAVSGAFASGPFASWPTLEPLLIGEGVWAGPDQAANLMSVYSIAMGAGMMSTLAAGILYDAIGPRAVGALCAFGCAICLLLMAAAIKIPMLNNLMWFAYPAATVFGWGNSIDVYAWLWLLPQDQSLVSAVVGAIQCLSDSFCLIAVLLHDVYGIQLPLYFTLIAILSVGAGILALVFVPTHAEILKISHAVIHSQAVEAQRIESYGAVDGGQPDKTLLEPEPQPDESEDHTVGAAVSKSYTAVKDTCILFYKIRPAISLLFFFYTMFQYMLTIYPTFVMYPLYVDLVGHARAVSLVNIFGGVYACIGALCLVVFGKAVDVIGVVQSVGWLNVPMLVMTYLFTVPTMSAQVVGQVLLAWAINSYYVYYPRFCLSYGPPQLFGTMYGMLCALQGIGQILLTRVGTWAVRDLGGYLYDGDAPRAFTFLATIDVWFFFTFASSCCLLVYWWYNPFPKAGATTMASVRNARNDSGSMSEKASLRSDKEIILGPQSLRPPGTAPPLSTCCSCLQGFKKTPAAKESA